MERKAQDVEALMAQATGKTALGHAIRAAELYMAAVAETADKTHASRLRRKCRDLILYAERLKGQHGLVPDSSLSALLRDSSRLHGNDFPPWTSQPDDDEFELLSGAALFLDDAVFTLSATQAENFASWTRPAELFNLDPKRDKTLDEEVMMQLTDRCDLVQDITTDCSVVASLSAAAKVLTGPRAVLSSIIYPFDHVRRRPKVSASGKYVLRMNFNGCTRRVVIDDRLPASCTDRNLFVVDRGNPCLLWPALLEKAYLKVRGGYDFPGSNSGTDLWVLTGWIPEQIFLQREDVDINETWARVKAAHESHDVVMTLGTGRISAEEERFMGLIGEHDYAVEDLDVCVSGARRVLVKNPWCDAPLVLEAGKPGSPSSAGDNTTWVALEDVVQHFESMYLNWNPALFPHRQDRHVKWSIPGKTLSESLVRNPQYAFSSRAQGPAWILVSRHFMDAELDIARNRRGSMASVSRQLGFMSILVFENKGLRAQVKGGENYRGPYVDSPQTLARLCLSAGRQYTVVVDQQELPLDTYTFTFSFFSHTPLEISDAAEEMLYFEEKSGSWTRRSAGGNSSCTTYCQNPQFRLSVGSSTPLSILLSTDDRDVHVHVDLVWAHGERAMSLRGKDVIASSGEYRRGCAVIDLPSLEPGLYTMICSTFVAGQTAAFTVRVSSMTPVSMDLLPANAAGMLRTPLSAFMLTCREERRRAPLQASWLTRASLFIRTSSSADCVDRTRPPSSTLLRISVVLGWGSEQINIATSGGGQFLEPATGVQTPNFDIEPARIQRGGMWIVVESIGSYHQAETINGEILSDSPIHVGPWELVR
ncbi:hypothetical protein HIM_04449 [Hirsutella minnesotensis 3608]|uniref:Calpain catalytic domain-containing protein n=1 Tax=Hirsutella minnesotensis 3608 TaxID=1043627 RepID=A0A0F7ZV49_9HYPO|nr:hypothetical protein HIM_04449 [Hirsutella minnesotensis 3608]